MNDKQINHLLSGYNSECTCARCEDAKQALRKLDTRAVCRWVPVSERLPNDDSEVITLCLNNGDRWMESSFYREGKWVYCAEYITHWLAGVPPVPKEPESARNCPVHRVEPEQQKDVR